MVLHFTSLLVNVVWVVRFHIFSLFHFQIFNSFFTCWNKKKMGQQQQHSCSNNYITFFLVCVWVYVCVFGCFVGVLEIYFTILIGKTAQKSNYVYLYLKTKMYQHKKNRIVLHFNTSSYVKKKCDFFSGNHGF